jgi:hypothetical protein
MNIPLLPLAVFRFEGIHPPWGYALWSGLVLAGAAVLYLTYRGIFQRSGNRLAWWLMALRGFGLLLLVLILAKPTWTREREQNEPGRVAIIVDTSRSMSLPDASGSSRYARAVEAAERLRKELSGKPKRLAVEFFDINGAPLEKLPKEPNADSTDLTRALRETATHLRAKPVAGIILISDGVDNTGRPNFLDWEDTSVPVHAVGFPRAVDFDLAVRKPEDQPRVMVHNEVTVKVPVLKRGKPASKATVTLRRGREVLASKKVKFPAGDGEQLVSLSYKPDQPGWFELTAEVEGPASESDLSNNAVNFPLEVVKDPIRVLYVEGFLRSEYTFLVRHFREKDPDVSLVPVPRRSSPDGPAKQLPGGVLTDRVLDKIDVVVLGDMPADYLTDPQYQTLLKWLRGKNHSLLVLGGYESFGAKGFRRNKAFAEVLPVVFAGTDEPQSERPFTLQLTEKGLAHAIFTVNSDRVRNRKLWESAPPLGGMPLVARARPGADVLAVNPRVEIEGKPAVAVAVQRAVGGGQVMVLCPDTTWHWTRLPRIAGLDDTLYSRFWSQAVRWLAGRTMEESRPLLSVRTGQPIHPVNKKVTVTVVRQRRPGSDLAGSRVTVDILDPKKRPMPGLTPRSSSADPDTFVVEFYPTAAGRYEVSAALKRESKVLANGNGEFRVRGADLELADPGTRPDNLRAIKEATGGTYVDIDDADEVKDRIERIERRQVRTQRSEYWDSPFLFAAFLLAVTGEWFLRRKNHLV